MFKIPEFNEFLDKIKQMEKGEKLDLSSDEDLSIGIMNLISIEEHLFFTANKTGKSEYYDILNEVREMRKGLLKKIIKDYEGEVWCISKHLLSASMRLMEVGTKMLSKGDKAGAEELFKKAYQLYSLFWGLNLGAIKKGDLPQVKEDDPKQEKMNFVNDPPKDNKTESTSIFARLGEILKKAIDCCKE